MASFSPIVCIVGFHHARGPEVETWLGVEEGSDPASENEWPLLPFMALSDGAHASTEDFSYFTLRHEVTPDRPATSLFGISCTRQLDANELINRPADVTRSTVQKAVVVISDSPHHFGQLREKLSIVTTAWFAQRDFTDLDILQKFQESLAKSFRDQDDERDQYFGLSLRELIHEFKYQTLVLFKCCLLQPKMLFFGSHCERLCMMQFSLISLIPGLIRHLQDCADPKFNSYEESLVMPTSLRTSERASLLAYMGLPLQIFGKGSLFGPYTPLQQLDMLADHGTKSYIVGSTNSLLLQQKDRYSDILINLDEHTINITSASLRTALTLSTPDRRWIDFLTQAVNDTWDESNPSRPKTMGYAGSEEFIRLQFEEYLLALLSAAKYRMYLQSHKDDENAILIDFEGDPSNEFGSEWVEAWMRTENFRIFSKFTDSHIFDIVDPKHPCSGGLTIEDVQRRLAQQVSELHLDERIQNSREVIGKQLAVGQKKVSSAFNNLWADIEVMREAQRKRNEEHKAAADGSGPSPAGDKSGHLARFPKAPDMSHAQASVQAASSRASAYLSSWGTWASEKRKAGWGRSSNPVTPLNSPPLKSPGDTEQSSSFSLQSNEKAIPTPPAAEVREPAASPSQGD
ncbi:cytoplasm protein [Glonium stellatum]|uniref:Cytoplasm protein n=1 Tax=Glonium stellatum TaxID=574774 RepID=A0A8E2FCM1_9PEZI|nr:cytoplasm protein [Glonium stellatum]